MTQSPKVPSFLTREELRALWNDAVPEDIAHDIELNPQVHYGKQQLTELELKRAKEMFATYVEVDESGK